MTINYKEVEKQLDEILEGNWGNVEDVEDFIKDMIARQTLEEKRKILKRLTEKTLMYSGDADLRVVQRQVHFAIAAFRDSNEGDFLRSDIGAALAKIHNPDSSFGGKVLEDTWENSDMGWNINYAVNLAQQLEHSIDAAFYAPATTRAEREKDLDLVKQKYLRKLPDMTQKKDMSRSTQLYRNEIVKKLCSIAHACKVLYEDDASTAVCEDLLTEIANRGYFEAQDYLMKRAMDKRDYKTANQWLNKMKNNETRVDGIPVTDMYFKQIATRSKELGAKEKATKQAQTVWHKGIRLKKTGRGLITVLKGLRNIGLIQTHKNQGQKK